MSRCVTVWLILLALAGCGDGTARQAEDRGQKETSAIEESHAAEPELLYSRMRPEEMAKQQVLEELAVRLKKLIKQTCPKAGLTISDESITFAFNDEVQCERAPYPGKGEMDWYYMAPKADGFRLEVQFMSEDGVEVPRPPQYLETSERTGFIRRFPLDWKKPHVLIVTLQRGLNLDPAIIEKIEPAIAAYAKERK